jgi:hypothetical protein
MYAPDGVNLSVAPSDYDNDGWPDLFVANDGIGAYLYHNEHNGTFTELALMSGMAYTQNGSSMAAMCMSLGDYDNDGNLDLYISDFQLASDHVWHNDGKGFFVEVSDQAGITIPTRNVLSFGGGFFDYDNDGLRDIFIANGHVYEEVEQVSPEMRYKQINSLFHNLGNRKFEEVSKSSGDGFTVPYAVRGAAFADFDNDGFLDVVIATTETRRSCYGTVGFPARHFINFRLIGNRSNRDGMGTRIRLRAGDQWQIREVASAGSYLSQSDLRANFGLKAATRVELVEVTWPSGLRQVFENLEADKFYVVEEGRDRVTAASVHVKTN